MRNGKVSKESHAFKLGHDLAAVPGQLVVAKQNSCEMPVPHWHAQVEINYIFSGGLTYRINDYDVELSEGDLCIFWGGQPHQSRQVKAGTEFVAMHLPLVHFFRLRLPAHLTQHLTKGGTLISNSESQSDHEAFRRMVNFMQSGDAARVEFAVEELLLRLNRVAFEDHELRGHHAETDPQPEPLDNSSLRSIVGICAYVTENFRENIGAADVASFVERHPKYAMSVFKKSTGMTLNEYITLLRISYAQSLLHSEEFSILEIAMESGFGSLSTFSQAFRKATGQSASAYRRLHQRSHQTVELGTIAS